jgi:hypothetical protein
MARRKNTALVNGQADALAAFFNSGTLKIYSGAQPASANDAASGTLLATINIPATAFGAAAAGVISKAGTWSAVAGATGTAGWARMESATGGRKMDFSVAESSGDLTIDDDAIVTGGVTTVTGLTLTTPAS